MTSLAAVLSPADLPWAELQAARLDGDLYELAGAYCLFGELEGPAHRARAVLAGRSARLIAELATAAWIWGADAEPARHAFAVTPEARARLSPASGAVVREIVYAPGDLTTLDGHRVTTPLRTAFDLARDDDWREPRHREIVARLAAIGGFDLADALTSLASRAGIPFRARTEQRLRIALTP
jgi:hypothetical protein